MPDLSSEIAKQRIRLGMTQQEVADLGHISVRLLRELEAGRANPGLKQLQRIATVLNLTLSLQPVTNETPSS